MSEYYWYRFYKQLQELGEISVSTWNLLRPIFSIREFEKGEFLSRTGDLDRKIAFVVEGIFRNFVYADDGIEVNLSFFLPDKIICTSMGTECAASTNTQALDKSIILEADYKDFLSLASHNEETANLQRNFLFLLVESSKLRETLLLSSSGREKYSKFVKEQGNLLQLIPHYHIASYLGMSATQLSRIRKKANDQHL